MPPIVIVPLRLKVSMSDETTRKRNGLSIWSATQRGARLEVGSKPMM